MKRRLFFIHVVVMLLLPMPIYAAQTIDLPEVIDIGNVKPPVYADTSGSKTLLWGLFEKKVVVGDMTRTTKLYIPQTAELGSYFVVLNVPDGQKTVPWLVESGWIELADQKSLCLYVMEAEGSTGEWGSSDKEKDERNLKLKMGVS